MAVKSKPAARPVPDRVEGLELTPGDNDGEIDAQWDPDDDATNYDVETSVDPVTASSRVHHSNGSYSRTTLTGLTSGARMCGCVCAARTPQAKARGAIPP